MARAIPRVEGDRLASPADAPSVIAVGTPAWYAWLEGATSFAFFGVSGHFTARKERRRQGDGYWTAYRKRGGGALRVVAAPAARNWRAWATGRRAGWPHNRGRSQRLDISSPIIRPALARRPVVSAAVARWHTPWPDSPARLDRFRRRSPPGGCRCRRTGRSSHRRSLARQPAAQRRPSDRWP